MKTGGLLRFLQSRKRSRGAVMVEYAFLLAFVFVPLSVGVVAGGRQALKDYRLTRGWVLKNTP
jgi:Flp pilus assembly pilin Flp